MSSLTSRAAVSARGSYCPGVPTYVCVNPECRDRGRTLPNRQCPTCFHYGSESAATPSEAGVATPSEAGASQPAGRTEAASPAPAIPRRRQAELTEPSRSWARETIDQLGSAVRAIGKSVEPLDAGSAGAAILARTDARYSAVIFAGAHENPSRVVLCAGVLKDLDAGALPVLLEAANAWNRTRAQGRCVVYVDDGRRVSVTLQETIVPAILTTVPLFFQSFLEAFAAEVRIARRHLRDFQLDGADFLIDSAQDAARALRTIDDEADLLLGGDELVNG